MTNMDFPGDVSRIDQLETTRRLVLFLDSHDGLSLDNVGKTIIAGGLSSTLLHYFDH